MFAFLSLSFFFLAVTHIIVIIENYYSVCVASCTTECSLRSETFFFFLMLMKEDDQEHVKHFALGYSVGNKTVKCVI